MEIITKRKAISTGINGFIQRYTGSFFVRNTEINLLQKLDSSSCSAEDVDEITGNACWTRLKCTECEQPVDAVASFGEYDGDYCDVKLCRSCLKHALERLEEP